MAEEKKKRKKRSGSKKGSPFEREISIEISLWWSWGDRDDLVWRTSQSGGRATERSKLSLSTKYQFGDLGPLDPCIFPLFDLLLFEMKRGYNKDLDLLEILDLPKHLKKVPILLEWWEKADRDRQRAGRKDKIIIMQRDFRKKLVVVSSALLGELEMVKGVSYTDKIIEVEDLCIMDFTDFFSFFEPSDIPPLLAKMP